MRTLEEQTAAARQVLRGVFGFDGFRPGQEAAIEALLAGRNVLTVMPTGSGKSLCFQIPALITDGFTVVVSPLVALMQDQVAALRLAGVAADSINSANERADNIAAWRRVAAGETRLLYMAPERLNRDHEALFGHDYDTAVLDEAQAVKNPAAGISKRIREIRARQRLVLTGTPLENNLQELWALYDWLIPGLLGNRKSFTAGFRTPIEKRDDRAKLRLLSTRVKPFLMRRTKEQVARDLPEKTVIDELIPLEGAQAALYESIRTAMDKRVREAIAARGLAASRIAILDALLKLRQVCCDPRLVRLDAARKVSESAKRARLLALLDELVAEGRRVLIFSQFVKMLKLVERDIAARGWSYAMLHGATKDRDAQVAAFQSGDLPLFLVSLKAGGTGLNLTAADTVIVYDPWWNPAVERQAMDRAHRIGQDKPVFVHRLIAENTVEAAIQRMQARKQALADALFEGTGQGPLALTEEDIHALFGPG